MTDGPDSRFMLRALELARRAWGMTSPNPLVGAVLVKEGRVIGEGWHHRAGEAHAEVNAFLDAEACGEDTAGAVLYVTLEPCSSTGRTPPCTEKILRSGVRKVVIGCLDPNPRHDGRAVSMLERGGIEVVAGVEEAACRELNRAFFCWIKTGRPLVILKLAVTLDGRIAAYTGDSRWVTGEFSRKRVQELRRLCDAVMVGAGTLKADHPHLTVREPADWPCQPLRIVASSTMTQEELNAYFPDGNAELADPGKEGWTAFLDRLGKRNITALLIEGGAGLAGSALDSGVVDRVEFHIAPKILGGDRSLGAVGGRNPERMAEALTLADVQVRRYGDDVAVSGDLK